MNISLIPFSADSKLAIFDIDKPLSGMKSEELIKLINDLKDIAVENGFGDVELSNDYDYYFFQAIK